MRIRISPPRIKIAASNFSRRFVGVQGRESHIFGNFAPPEAQNRPARGPRVGLACAYRGQSPLSTCVRFSFSVLSQEMAEKNDSGRT